MPTMECTFWAVGQGLFSSGRIFGKNGEKFNWVYDCGAVKSAKPFLTTSINKMRSENSDDIDLLIISHFDEDHILGLGDLLLGKKVKRLIIPYFPLWKRLILAYQENIKIDSPLFAFYLNPTQYILERFFDSTNQILLLPETNNIDFPVEPKNPKNREYSELNEKALYYDNKVELLSQGWAYLHYNAIEFIPYNAPLSDLQKFPSDFEQYRDEVEKVALAQKYSDVEIKELKSICDRYFVRSNKKGKKNSQDRNTISLFLCVGYIEDTKQVVKVKYFQHISLFEERKSEGVYSKVRG